MVPEGWSRKPVKELCDSIIDCVNKTAPTVDYRTPYKMIRTTNVRNGVVDTVNVKYVEKDVYEQWVRRGAPVKGDIILTREAPVGEVGLLTDAKGVFLGQRTVMYRADPDKADNRFLLYILQSPFCQKQIDNLSNGGTVEHMRVPDCGEIVVNAPPILEQQKIAKILSTWDEAIATTEQLLANSEQQKKALMQQLLTGKKRLPGFEGEWEELLLGDIANVSKGKALSGKNLVDGFYPVVAGGKVSPYTHNSYTHENAITVSASGAYAGYVAYHGYKFWASDCSVVEENDKSDIRFLEQLLIWRQNKIYSLQSGGAQPHVYPKDLKLMRFYVPPVDEQIAIARVLVACAEEESLLVYQVEKLKKEKKALMQQLLTGKRRVKVDEAEQASA